MAYSGYSFSLTSVNRSVVTSMKRIFEGDERKRSEEVVEEFGEELEGFRERCM
jgi:hypothetical protein